MGLLNKKNISDIDKVSKSSEFVCYCVLPSIKDYNTLGYNDYKNPRYIISLQDKNGIEVFFMNHEQVKRFLKEKYYDTFSIIFGVKRNIGKYLDMEYHNFAEEYAVNNPDFIALSNKELKKIK